MTDPILWIDPLHDLSVRYAAELWGKDLPETWGILSRAIKAEDLSNPVPVHEFIAFTKSRLPAPPPPAPVPAETQPTGGLHGLWLTQYKEFQERSIEPYQPNGWHALGFFILFLFINNILWQDTNIPEDGAVFYLLISFFLTLAALAGFTLLLRALRGKR